MTAWEEEKALSTQMLLLLIYFLISNTVTPKSWFSDNGCDSNKGQYFEIAKETKDIVYNRWFASRHGQLREQQQCLLK